MKIFEQLGAAQPNLEIIATHVRQGKERPSYVLRNGSSLTMVVDKWDFEPKSDPISRCGHDYQVVARNGEVTLSISICFACNTLVLNGTEKFGIRERLIKKLLAEDFEVSG